MRNMGKGPVFNSPDMHIKQNITQKSKLPTSVTVSRMVSKD